VSRSDDQRIGDILDAAAELALVVAPGRDMFLADPIRRRAAERLLEIIGESVNALSEQTTNRYPTVPWRDIARLRVLLAHHYHRVDPAQVFVIATRDVPPLVEALSDPTAG
jgi:uncharacterized protein with HEPN domain